MPGARRGRLLHGGRAGPGAVCNGSIELPRCHEKIICETSLLCDWRHTTAKIPVPGPAESNGRRPPSTIADQLLEGPPVADHETAASLVENSLVSPRLQQAAHPLPRSAQQGGELGMGNVQARIG